MPASMQIDLFGETQADLFGDQPARDYRPDPAKVRSKLLTILAKARAAPDEPWSRRDMEFYRVVFPQMSNWLPTEEAQRLCHEFAAEVARLECA
jgi:hypothetical protein